MILIGQFVRRATICYTGPISVPTNKQLLKEKRSCAKFQIGISKTEGLVCVYIDGQTDISIHTEYDL